MARKKGAHEQKAAPRPSRPSVKTNKPAKAKKKSPAGIIIAVVVALLAAAAALVAVFSAKVAKLDTVFPNVSVAGVDVGSMTYDEALDALRAAGVGAEGGETVTVTLPGDVKCVVSREQAGLSHDAESAAQIAWDYGRDGGRISSAVKYVRCAFGGVELAGGDAASIDESAVRAIIAEAAQQARYDVVDGSFTMSGDAIKLTKSGSLVIDEDEVYSLVRDALEKEGSGAVEYEGRGEAVSDECIDTIYQQIHTEPVSAEYDPETQSATQSVVGVSFDVQQAKKDYNAASIGDTITIPLVMTEPETTTEYLDSRLFADVLGEKTTTMYTSSSNRVNNIATAASAINGTVLMPGDEFSFNGIVGKRTAEKGYKLAGAYVAGETVEQIGGGICQVSSTIYYCVLKADLKVTERSNHVFTVDYLPLGMDATVNWGSLDFKFVNDTEWPIRISAHVENRALTVQLLGTDEDGGYLELSYAVNEVYNKSVVEEVDETLAPGASKVKTSGHTGYKVTTYKTYYDADGNKLNTVTVGTSTYRKQDRVVLVGPTPEPDTGGGETPTPPDGGNTPTPPDGGGDTPTPPDGGGDTPTPPDGGETTPPDGGGDTAPVDVPADGGETPAPTDGDEA